MFPLLFVLFIALPIAELWLIIEIGGAIGVLPTLALLVVSSVVGAGLARSQSRAAWDRFNTTMAAGRVPGKEVFDGAMIILGGALLLTPGFITDGFGIALLLPPTRALIRAALTRMVARRGAVAFRVARFGSQRYGASRSQSQRPGYDYEGTATDVTEPSPELDPGARSGDARG